MKFLRSLLFAAALLFVPLTASTASAPAPFAPASIQAPKGFTKKAYDATFALFASSVDAGVEDRFICTVTAVKKVKGGYMLLGAGHCTPANVENLPPDMTFDVSQQLGGKLEPVVLVAAQMQEPLDYSIFYFPTKEKFPVIKMGDERLARIGDKTVDVNFSLGTTKEVSPGIVVSNVIRDTVQDGTQGFFEVQMFGSHGASGSSVIDLKGDSGKEVIGIVIAGFDGATVPELIEPISTIETAIKNLKMPTVTAAQILKSRSLETVSPRDPHAPLVRDKEDPCARVLNTAYTFVGKSSDTFLKAYGDPTSTAIESPTESHYAYARTFGKNNFIDFEFIAVNDLVTRVQEDACYEGSGNIQAPALPPGLQLQSAWQRGSRGGARSGARPTPPAPRPVPPARVTPKQPQEPRQPREPQHPREVRPNHSDRDHHVRVDHRHTRRHEGRVEVCYEGVWFAPVAAWPDWAFEEQVYFVDLDGEWYIVNYDDPQEMVIVEIVQVCE
jgi:hypothetical protein